LFERDGYVSIYNELPEFAGMNNDVF